MTPYARFARSTLLGAAIVVVGSACGGAGTANRTVTAAQVDGGAGFDPATITVHKNDKVKLKVANSTDKPHGFTIVGYGIREEVAPGTPIDIKFTASRAGTYEIRCQLHPAHQPATLVVE